MTRILLQGNKVCETYKNETLTEIKQEVAKLRLNSQGAMLQAVEDLNSLLTPVPPLSNKTAWKYIDNCAKEIRACIKVLTSDFTVIDGGEAISVGGEHDEAN